jgi:hypothetical protein
VAQTRAISLGVLRKEMADLDSDELLYRPHWIAT